MFDLIWSPRSEAAIWEPVPIRTFEQKKAGLSGGEGFQMVHAIAYAPSDSSVIYLSTDTSQVWKSSDGGSNWKSKNNGFISNGARSLAVDPKNANIVFAAGFLGSDYKRANKQTNRLQGIYKTIDGGENWNLIKKTSFYRQKSKGNLFAFDTSINATLKTKIIFAGSYNEGLLRSVDGGNTWESVGFAEHHILDLEKNPAKPGEFFIVTEKGLFKYFNGVEKRIGNGLPDWPRSIAVSSKNHRSLYATFGKKCDSRIIYAAVGKNGIYKSIDSGSHFKESNNSILLQLNVTDISVSPLTSDIVFVTAHKNFLHKPLVSYDGARSWRRSESVNLKNFLPKEKGFLFSSPFAMHPRKEKTAITASNGKGRILKTVDGGKNWIYSGSGFTGGRMRDIAFSKDGKMIFCLTDHGLFLTDNDGDTFKDLNVKRILGFKSSCSAAIMDNSIVASIGSWGKKGLAVSYNLGRTWYTFNKYIGKYPFIAFHPEHKNIIYAGSYRSRDKGKSWTKLAQEVRAMYAENGDIIYAVSLLGKRKCAILKSIDQGETWLKPYPACPFSSKAVKDMAVFPGNPDRLYLATSKGFWILSKEELILRNEKNGLDKDYFNRCYISSISVDPNSPNHIYVGRQAPGCGQSNGVFRSTDRGLSWNNMNHNLGPELTVWAVEVSPLDGSIYLGTSLGTWRYRLGAGNLKD